MEQTEFQDRMSDLKARSMWLVTDSAEMANVTAYLDENNKVVMFYARTKGDVYMALDGYRFFDTEKEALEWHEKLILNLRDKMKQCRELIEELDGLHSNKHFSFKKEDYLGMYGKEKSNHYCEEMRTFMDACHILSLAVGPKVLNINGQTIPLSEVVSVNWHNGHNATLILKNGSVSTHRYAEYVALEFIYGNNNSGRVMVNANQSDDEK